MTKSDEGSHICVPKQQKPQWGYKGKTHSWGRWSEEELSNHVHGRDSV